VWIVRGRLHPQTPADIPLLVGNWLGPVGEVLRGMDEEAADRRSR
jgi:hypothetical protein